MEKPLEPVAGLNRFSWDLRVLTPTLVPKAVLWGSKEGPLVAPGRTASASPPSARRGRRPSRSSRTRVKVSAEDLARQAALLAELNAALSRTHETVGALRDARAQVAAIAARAKKAGAPGAVGEAAKALDARLLAAEEKLVNPKLKSSQDVLNFPPALDHQIVGLVSAASSADAPPTGGRPRLLGRAEGSARGGRGGGAGGPRTRLAASTPSSPPPASRRSSRSARRRPRERRPGARPGRRRGGQVVQGVLLVLEDVEDGEERREVEGLLDPLREPQEPQLGTERVAELVARDELADPGAVDDLDPGEVQEDLLPPLGQELVHDLAQDLVPDLRRRAFRSGRRRRRRPSFGPRRAWCGPS